MGRWDPQAHPRGPGGRFVKKGAVGQVAKALAKDTGGGGVGWAQQVSDKAGRRGRTELGYAHVPGTDQTDWLIQNAPKLDAERVRRTTTATRPGGRLVGNNYGDVHLQHIAVKHGWDAQPAQGTKVELDAAVKAGGVEIHRGVTGHSEDPADWGALNGPHDPQRTPTAILRRLREGPVEYGSGLYGQGLYFSISRQAANAYGQKVQTGTGRWGWTTDPRSIQRAVLKPDARVLEHGSPEAEKLIAGLVTRLRFHHSNSHGSAQRAAMDLGRAAAAAGYDAIRVPAGKSDGSNLNAEQYVVLNRTALLLQRPTPPKKTR